MPSQDRPDESPPSDTPAAGSAPSTDRPRPFASPSARTSSASPPDTSSPDRTTVAADGDRSAPPPSTPITQQIGRVVVVLLAVGFGVFAVANAQHVAFSWLFGETQVMVDASGERLSGGVPLIVLLVASLAIGVVVGMTIAWQRARQRARRHARQDHDDHAKSSRRRSSKSS